MASTYLCLLLWKSGLITIFTLLVVLFPCENIFFFFCFHKIFKRHKNIYVYMLL